MDPHIVVECCDGYDPLYGQWYPDGISTPKWGRKPWALDAVEKIIPDLSLLLPCLDFSLC